MIAANIDTLFIVMALNNDFNLRRLERYLTVSWESRAVPVVILTKADLCDDLPLYLTEVESVAIGVDIHAISAISGQGIEALGRYLQKGRQLH